MANSVGARAWSSASRPWESAESHNECPLPGHFLRLGVGLCRQHEHGLTILSEDPISITTAGSNPIAWQAGQAQLPLRRHPEKLPEQPATDLGAGSEDLETQLTQQRVWADRSAVGQSTPWDAGRDAPTQGQLVDAYA
jgi:hypothetical protein